MQVIVNKLHIGYEIFKKKYFNNLIVIMQIIYMQKDLIKAKYKFLTQIWFCDAINGYERLNICVVCVGNF